MGELNCDAVYKIRLMKGEKEKIEEEEWDYNRKIIIIGDSGVGKSSLLIRYTDGKFVENTLMTIGICHCWKVIQIDGIKLKLQIWDTAGQDKYKTITKNYYRNTHGAIISFSINDYDSFMSVRTWIDNLTSEAKQDISILLVGTKKDLEQKRQVSFKQALEFADKNSMEYMECSSKNNECVEEVFLQMGKMIKLKSIDVKLEKKDEEQRNKEKSLRLATKFRQQIHKNCCRSS